ncbi:MAG: hypothetical protein K9M44_02755 [Candidatus Pacebacteria bacterium]|nr:hypothetical protein [Candidatus Paceibacterota bacterium]
MTEIGNKNNKNSAQAKAISALNDKNSSSAKSSRGKLDLEEMSEAKLKAQIQRRSKINSFLNKNFPFIIVFIILAILALSFFYVIKPKYFKAIEAIEGNLSSQKAIYLEQLTKLNNYKSLVNAYQQVSPSEIEKINSILPTKYEKEKLFIELGYVIPQNGFQLDNLSIEESETEEAVAAPRTVRGEEEEVGEMDFLKKLPKEIGYLKINLDISLVDYKNFKRLLNILENNIKLLDIYSVNFNPSSESVQISLVTYYLKAKP